MLHISTEMKTHRASGQCCSDLTNEQAVFEEKSLDRIREPSHRSYFEWRGKKVNLVIVCLLKIIKTNLY